MFPFLLAATVPTPTVFTAATLGGTPQVSARFGQSLATGDFDDNRVDDLAIAAPRESVGTAAAAGRVYVVHGALATNAGCSFCGPIVGLTGGGLIAASAVQVTASQVGLAATSGALFGTTT